MNGAWRQRPDPLLQPGRKSERHAPHHRDDLASVIVDPVFVSPKKRHRERFERVSADPGHF